MLPTLLRDEAQRLRATADELHLRAFSLTWRGQAAEAFRRAAQVQIDQVQRAAVACDRAADTMDAISGLP